MPDSHSHFRQADRNLQVVSWLNQSHDGYWDWQVTTLFYSALHLVNGHIMLTEGTFYNSHSAVQAIIHWQSGTKAQLPREIGMEYEKLQLLSRKSRYLYDPSNPHQPSMIGPRGFESAVIAYERITSCICDLHGIGLQAVRINCTKAGWTNRPLPNNHK